VKYVHNIDEYDVYEEGRKIRYNDRFAKEGTNVNFVEQLDNVLKVRTYERGVEDETYSCGTGVTASAIVASLAQMTSPVSIVTPGGKLQVEFQAHGNTFTNIYLTGPAEKVFEGSLEIH
jgi:diaminopimelate epimerase